MKKLLFLFFLLQTAFAQSQRPNILFIIADDWSHPHAGIYGDKVVQTPNFDRIAREGLVFDHAYVSSPSCTPSRAAIVTGQQFWRLGIGANLYGPLPAEHAVYTDLLEEAGYMVGFTRKGWAPGAHEGRKRNPAGDRFKDFEEFLSKRTEGKPFCFWFGSHEPHRGYKKGAGKAAGIDPSIIDAPACFPNTDEVRNDVADYYEEVQQYDAQIGSLLRELEAIGELDNTLIAITSDNGMPFPRCKGNLYDMGTRMPLAIRWGNGIKRPRRIVDFVSLTDLAPTFLEAAQVDVPEAMTGKSLFPMLTGTSTAPDQNRQRVFFGRERHLPAQENGDVGGYPMRAIRTPYFLYIHNFRPDRWPAGTPNWRQSSFFPSYYADVDGSPTRTYMIDHQEKDYMHNWLFQLAFDKRPWEELYDLRNDPNQLHNLAMDPDYEKIRKGMKEQLFAELRRTNDPRVLGGEEIFESYPYTGGTIYPDQFKRQSRRYATVKIDTFPSKYADPRSVEILVPTQVSHDQRFPVLYMFDGQNIFHSFKGWGGEENKGWQVDEVLDSLFLANEIPQMIVVGIFNGTNKRGAEYLPQQPADLLKDLIAKTEDEWLKSFRDTPPESDAQLKFIVEELKPFIDANFKTRPDQANTFVGGSSMGGLISAYAICEYPEVFAGAACFSTHWPIFDGFFLEYIKENLPDPSSHKIYFDFGTEGLDGEYEPYQQIADKAMLAKGYQHGKNWMTRKFIGAKHHEDDWNARFHVPIKFLLGKE